ncbi:hypothetical protein QQP08_008480 [Theobroma cacao]|nr:hypothetical protein QQP08_008480 [Theobroma cacao]
MTWESPKDAWDCLKEEFHGNKRTHQMQALNLRKEIEILRMENDESMKEYLDKIMKFVNQLKLLGEEMSNHGIVNKLIVSLPKKFKAKISSLKDSKDLSQLSVIELKCFTSSRTNEGLSQ